MSIFYNKRRYELDHKATILIMRWLVVLLVVIMAVYSAGGFEFFSPNYLLAMAVVAANAVVSLFPERLFERTWFTYALFLLDIAFVSAMIYFSEGINTDFYLVYFLSIFMSSIGRSISGAVPVALIASLIYGWLVFRQGGVEMLSTPAFWLRVPFFMLVALFSSLWAGRVEEERKKKMEAERFQIKLQEEVEAATAEIRCTMENLRVLKEYNENILASISSGVLVVDMNGEVTTFNRRAADIFQITAGSVLGRRLAEISEFLPLAEVLESTLNTGQPRHDLEIKLLMDQSRELVLMVTTSILHHQTTRSNGAIAVFNDVTATKRLEERVKQSEKLAVLGEMAAVMAHEIRNPLNSIAGFAQLLKTKTQVDAKIQRFVEIIVNEAFRIDAIISDILDFSRGRKLTIEPLRVDEMLQGLMDSYEIRKDDKKIDLVLETGSDISAIRGDRMRLERAIINLINNARESIAECGRIVIKAESELGTEGTRAVRISVSDNGCGISEEMKEKIFQPFFTTKSTGTGLGLAIIKRIVEEHGGRLEVSSQLGQGSVFGLVLPAEAESQEMKRVA